jgi:hypothetical protein
MVVPFVLEQSEEKLITGRDILVVNVGDQLTQRRLTEAHLYKELYSSGCDSFVLVSLVAYLLSSDRSDPQLRAFWQCLRCSSPE